MEIDTVVTLDDNKKYYLADVTEQDGKRYFLANLIDEEGDPTLESNIFVEDKEGDNYYLDPVTDEKVFNYITAVFAANLNDLIQEEA